MLLLFREFLSLCQCIFHLLRCFPGLKQFPGNLSVLSRHFLQLGRKTRTFFFELPSLLLFFRPFVLPVFPLLFQSLLQRPVFRFLTFQFLLQGIQCLLQFIGLQRLRLQGFEFSKLGS